MGLELPVTDDDMVASIRGEYEELAKKGSDQAAHACFRLAWVYVHSARNTDVKRGLDLAEQLLKSSDLDEQDHRDLVYLTSVAQYKLGDVLAAKRQLEELLKVAPNGRQAQVLREACEQQIIKEGLLGIGIGSAVLGIAALAIGIAFGARR